MDKMCHHHHHHHHSSFTHHVSVYCKPSAASSPAATLKTCVADSEESLGRDRVPEEKNALGMLVTHKPCTVSRLMMWQPC